MPRVTGAARPTSAVVLTVRRQSSVEYWTSTRGRSEGRFVKDDRDEDSI